MKITCTEDEKEELIYELSTYSIDDEVGCLFINTRDGRCLGKINCQQCIADNIEWEVTNMSEKIIQIIPAPEGLTVLFQHFYYTGETEWKETENGVKYINEIEKPEFDDCGDPVNDEYPALCLALIEDEEGKRSITPVFYDDSFDGTKNIELASDYNYFNGFEWNRSDSSNSDSVKVGVHIQDEMGTVFISESTSRYIFRKDNGLYGVYVLIDGKQIETGEYSDKKTAQLAMDKIDYAGRSCEDCWMPSRKEMDNEMEKEQAQREYRRIKRLFQEELSLTSTSAEALIRAGYRTIEEVEAVTDEEMKQRNIKKQTRDTILRRIAKLADAKEE